MNNARDSIGVNYNGGSGGIVSVRIRNGPDFLKAGGVSVMAGSEMHWNWSGFSGFSTPLKKDSHEL